MKYALTLTTAILALLLSAALLPGCNGATNHALELVGKDGSTGFMFHTLARGNHVRKYGLFVPLNYKPTNKYPVIVFLQGVGEGAGIGEGDGKNMTVGLGPFVAAQRDTFPFIVIFPQSSGGWDANSEYAQDVITALDDVEKAYSVDKDRVCLTGLSTGGYGCYVIGAKYAERFAAIVPMGSNGASIESAEKLKHVAVRAYCSESGDIFAGNNDQRMVERINAIGGRADFIQTPTSGHDCWEYVYGSGELFGWMQQQRRYVMPATPRTTGSVAPARGTSPVLSNASAVVPGL